MNAYPFCEKAEVSQYDKQYLYSFSKPSEQIKLRHEEHTKALSSLLKTLSSNLLKDCVILRPVISRSDAI